MNAIIEQLLEAHVRHELLRFNPKRFPQTLRAEVAAVFAWLNQTKLRDVVTPDQIVALIARNVVERPVALGIIDLARSMSRRVLASRQSRSTTVEDICPRSSFDAVVAKLASLEDARRDFIHRLVTSSVYTEQISDVLFTGIKEYLLTENILAQKVPGLASLIRLGKFAVNKTMKPLEVAVEKTVRAYIETNLGNTIRRSEQSINDYFGAARMGGMGDAVWDAMATRKLSEYFKMLDGGDMDDFVAIGHEFWLHFRRTPYFKAIYTDLVQHFFEKFGDSELGLIAAGLGVNEKIVVSELLQTLSTGIETAFTSGFLEQRIRAQLEPFYRAPETARLLAGSIGPAAPRVAEAVARKPRSAAAAREQAQASKVAKPRKVAAARKVV